jgi:outer membrane receptor protein involved in Fe transport
MRMGCSKDTWGFIQLRALGRAAGIVLGIAMPVIPAIAQQAALEEIIVTATKRGAVSVQEIPGGVRAITGEFIDNFNVRSLEDVTRFEPSFEYIPRGTGDLQLVLRGIQSPGAGTVGLYFDETVITGANFQDGGGRTPDIGAYDLERVEILKGPQGTLFGASSMSGTVRMISNKPNAEGFDAAASVGFMSVDDGGDGYEVHGMLNFPIIEDSLALRGVAWQREDGGFIDQLAGYEPQTLLREVNDSEKTGGRIMLRWLASEAVTLDAYYQTQDTDVDGAQHYAPQPGGVLVPIDIIVAPVPPIPGVPGIFGDLQTTTPGQEPWEDEVDMYGITVQWDLGFGSLLGTVSSYERDTFMAEDTSATAISFGFPPAFGAPVIGSYNIHQFQEREVTTAELRFSSSLDGPINYVVGAHYSDDEAETELDILAGNSATGIPICQSRDECISDPALAAQSLAFARDQSIDFSFYALFGHLDWDITEKFSVGGGLRYFDSEQDNVERTLQAFQGSIDFTLPPLFGGPIQTDPIINVDQSVDEDEVTWDASVSYQRNDDQLYYIRAATGFRQGGINDSATASVFGLTIPSSFTSDDLLSIDIGAKTSWLDDRVVLNAAYFKMFWDDIQVPGQEPTGAVEFIANAAEAEIDGIEVELFARPTEQWFLSLGATWMDASLTDDQQVDPALDAPGFDPPLGRDGDDIPLVPEWSLSAVAEFTFPVFANVETALRGNFSYTDKSYTFLNATFPGYAEVGDYSLLNLSVGFRYENWELLLLADNVTDERGVIDIDNPAGPDNLRYFAIRPRSYGVQLNWKYK